MRWSPCGVATILAALTLGLACLILASTTSPQVASPTPVGHLRAIHSAQALFREGDRDHDGRPDYATLAALSSAGLIDPLLGGGTRSGYAFRCEPGPDPERTWFAIANPLPGWEELGSYFVNQDGAVCRRASPIGVAEIRSGCAPPSGCVTLFTVPPP